MVELGQLEKQNAEFKKRNVRVVAVSNDDQITARETQKDFPGLVVVADTDQNLAKALEVIHPGAAVDGSDTNAPTTFLVDGAGTVRWLFRPGSFLERLSPRELLAAIDAKAKS
jgi:alkyl hydroperoxide reductase subunit AhpC